MQITAPSIFIALALGAVGQVLAQDLPDYTLADLSLGSVVAGDEIDLTALDGRVVAIEYWGPN